MPAARSLIVASIILAFAAQAAAQPYIRKGDDIVLAPEEDQKVVRSYQDFKDKGEVTKGRRITILTAKTEYEAGEEVRVIHVLEATEPGLDVWVMGPKTIDEEYVDGKRADQQGPDMTGYHGRVGKSPAADLNYAITSYRFNEPGSHAIQWRGGGYEVCHRLGITGNLSLSSNTIKIVVKRSLSAKDVAVLEAALRGPLRNGQQDKINFVAIGSRETGWKDPPPEVLKRLTDLPFKLAPVSAAGLSKPGPDETPNDRASKDEDILKHSYVYWAEIKDWISDTKVRVYAGHWSGPKRAGSNVSVFELRDGRWVVSKIQQDAKY